MNHNIFNNIRIILVGTTLPANIGSVARAMKTCAVKHLYLVAPKHPIDDTSIAHAKGGADILQNAIVCDTLEEALTDCHYIFASSSRSRKLPRPVVAPRKMAQMMHHALQDNVHKIALIFGREDRGLTNDELMLAHFHVQIPTNTEYGVLNIASATQSLLCTLYEYVHERDKNTVCSNFLPIQFVSQWDSPAIDFAQKKALDDVFLKLLQKLELLHDDKKDLPSLIARLSSRLWLDKKEYALLMRTIHTILDKV